MPPTATPWTAAYARTSGGLTCRLKMLTIARPKPTIAASATTPMPSAGAQVAAPVTTSSPEQHPGLDHDVVDGEPLRGAVDVGDLLRGRRSAQALDQGRAAREDGVAALVQSHGLLLSSARATGGTRTVTTLGDVHNVPDRRLRSVPRSAQAVPPAGLEPAPQAV